MKILVSACLLGCNCKYNGGNNLNEELRDYLRGHEIITICPEVDGGLSTPRLPSEIKGDRVLNKAGIDVSKEFNYGANKTLKKALEYQVDLAILKERSPSCGSKEVYDGSFSGKLISGEGITVKLLKQNGIKVYSEEDLEFLKTILK